MLARQDHHVLVERGDDCFDVLFAQAVQVRSLGSQHRKCVHVYHVCHLCLHVVPLPVVHFL